MFAFHTPTYWSVTAKTPDMATEEKAEWNQGSVVTIPATRTKYRASRKNLVRPRLSVRCADSNSFSMTERADHVFAHDLVDLPFRVTTIEQLLRNNRVSGNILELSRQT